MTKVVRLHAANEDLLAIGVYGSFEWGTHRAESFVRSFDDAFNLLSRHPDIGRRRNDIGAAVRSWLHHGYVIYYRHVGDEVVIGRVLHGSAEPRSRVTFGDSDPWGQE